MPEVLRLNYLETDPSLGTASALPYAPIRLEYGGRVISASALVDSGAALNVLPYDLGLQLGADWNQQTVPIKLGGNLAASEARAILLPTSVGDYSPTRLAFAWSRSNDVPVIFGQVNFFMEFNVCFFRSEAAFEISPK